MFGKYTVYLDIQLIYIEEAEDIQRERVNNLGKWKLKILTPLLLLVGNVSRLEVLSERTAIQGLNISCPRLYLL